MTIEEVGQLFKLINSAYQNAKLTRDNVDGYHLMLADIPLEDAKPKLLTILMEHPTFPPSAPALRNALIGTPSDQTGIPDYAAAWDEVMALVVFPGYYGTPRYSHPLIKRAVDAMGGWQTMCSLDTNDLPTVRAQFRDMYRSFRESEVREVTGAKIRIVAGPDVLGELAG